MTYKLKPCPFCGGNASIHSTPITQGYEYYVCCDDCKARIGTSTASGYDFVSIDTAKTVVSLIWNHRTATKIDDEKEGGEI